MSNQSLHPLSYSYTPTHHTAYNTPITRAPQNVVTLFTKSPNTNADNYSSPYGIPFECIEFIRRIFSTQANYTFTSIEDAEEMFHKINSLQHISNPAHIISLKTYQYPYATIGENPTKNIASYVKPGNLLFWKKKKNEPDLQYGHVAIIIYVDEFIVKIAQQNFHPPLQTIHTPDLISEMNSPDSKFLGIKVLPPHLRDLISNRIQHIQVKHIDA